MLPTYNAFLPGEWVEIATAQDLECALAHYRNGPTILTELLARVGERVRIVGYSFPHGAGVLYELSGVALEVWQECLVDWTIREDDESGVRASTVYSARPITEAGEAFVVIEDKRGRAFAKLWRANPAQAVSEIMEVASLRSRGAFEGRFHFEGDYANRRKG
jgi:hypothetical protein